MNDELHNKVVKFFYDHEELFIAIMNKTPYQSDGWDYEIEVVKEFLTANQSCYCGDIYNLGVIHRDDGPCHYPDHKEPEPEPVAFPRNVQEYDEDWIIDPAFISRVKHSIDPETPYEFTPSEEQIETTLLALEVIPASLYTTPPQRKPLTDEEIQMCYETTGHYQTLRPQDRFAVFALARAIEAKLKEKKHEMP